LRFGDFGAKGRANTDECLRNRRVTLDFSRHADAFNLFLEGDAALYGMMG
jgi:hypothetical protein